MSGWATLFVDLNNDGLKDLFTANSHVNDRVESFEASVYKQPNSIFINTGSGKFRDGSADAGPEFRAAVAAHHGAAAADFNDDGRIDIAVSALGGPAELWENTSAQAGHWIILKLIGTRSNRDGIGARITIGNQTRTVTTASGYVSSSDVRAHFGLGDDDDDRSHRDRVAQRHEAGARKGRGRSRADGHGRQVAAIHAPRAG